MRKIKYLFINAIIFTILIVDLKSMGYITKGMPPIGNSNDSIINIKFYKEFSYKIDNKNQDQVGYIVLKGDESVGVKSLCVDSTFVFITDVVHSSIKKIDINSGKIIANATMNLAYYYTWLRDIYCFNRRIFATSDLDSIYVYNYNLDSHLSVYTSKGSKWITSSNTDSLFIFLNEKQLFDFSFEDSLLLIDKYGEINKISKNFSEVEWKKEASQHSSHGYVYDTYFREGNYYLKSRFGIIKLKNKIPNINLYDANNVFLNENTLAFFNITPTEFKLYIYRW